MIESDASFGLHAIVLAAIMDEYMINQSIRNQSINQSERIKVTKVTNVTARPLINEKRLFEYTQMSMR